MRAPWWLGVVFYKRYVLSCDSWRKQLISGIAGVEHKPGSTCKLRSSTLQGPSGPVRQEVKRVCGRWSAQCRPCSNSLRLLHWVRSAHALVPAYHTCRFNDVCV